MQLDTQTAPCATHKEFSPALVVLTLLVPTALIVPVAVVLVAVAILAVLAFAAAMLAVALPVRPASHHCDIKSSTVQQKSHQLLQPDIADPFQAFQTAPCATHKKILTCTCGPCTSRSNRTDYPCSSRTCSSGHPCSTCLRRSHARCRTPCTTCTNITHQT